MLDVHTETARIDPAIDELIERRSGHIIDTLQSLVKIPSDTVNGEIRLAKRLHEILLESAVESTIIGQSQNTTVFASIGAGPHGFFLDGPLDTTPAGNKDDWTFGGPYSARVVEDKMYGIGTADCKGGIVAAVFACLALKELVAPTEYRAMLIMDGGEQGGAYHGMQTMLAQGLAQKVSAGIVTYAGDPDEIAIGARGYHRFVIQTEGTMRHTGSRNGIVDNAIVHMAHVITALGEIELPLPQDPLFKFGSRITPSLIQGGTAINQVPGACELRVDTRVTPDLTKTQIEELIGQAMMNALRRSNQSFRSNVLYDVGKEAYKVNKDSPLVHSVLQAAHAAGRQPRLVAHGPANIGNLLAEHGIDVLVTGPYGGNTHAVNEWVDIESVVQTAKMYAQSIINYNHLMRAIANA
jgi:acetylornithine deacetylase/succinyl-diaminopimelate desuccinylase-like protein